jgi:hypothetical protein
MALQHTHIDMSIENNFYISGIVTVKIPRITPKKSNNTRNYKEWQNNWISDADTSNVICLFLTNTGRVCVFKDKRIS